MKPESLRRLVVAPLSAILAAAMMLCACGGGAIPTTPCTGQCGTDTPQHLTVADVQKVIAQAVAEAQARNAKATIAVVDRVGNVLGVFAMHGANPGALRVDSGRAVVGGLDGIEFRSLLTSLGYPDVQAGVDGVAALMAIAKAITGAYLSSEGNAFTTRTASQIVQEFFNPGEFDQPGGPLFGVQFSQLPCSDLAARFTGSRPSPGPHRSPLGLSADPGGFPLYKNGVPVGGIGVLADGVYGLDLDLRDTDQDLDELIALAGTIGFDAPQDRRADRITVAGKTLRYSDARPSDLLTRAADAPAFASLDGVSGRRLAVPGYTGDDGLVAGLAFGQPASGIRPATGPLAALDGFVLVDAANQNRFPARAATDAAATGSAALTAVEVQTLLEEALGIANRARAQIRRPLSTPARVSIAVVDTYGSVLGIVRSRDAPVFGIDVALQKARSAMFFSHPSAASDLQSAPDITYLGNGATQSIADYAPATRQFFGLPDILDGAYGFASRSIGNFARPYFPDGIRGSPNGPIAKPIAQWSPFNVGLQLDLDYTAIVTHLLFVLGVGPDVAAGGCTALPSPSGSGPSRLANGLQIFAGGIPLYRGNQLVGGIGVSGDGIDQDDMIAFLGTYHAALRLGSGLATAPPAMRADTIVRRDDVGEPVHLRYVQCPQAPFLDTDEQNVCDGK
ncbi:Haem-degrading [Fontimonas thermophila]|uniref:Haem-degrading n=1 Tax=Fontimonas thermophila TaxID=1076937 RepID=A0A1I2I8L1_9GAMM|nr:heme-binding protein [Fontimonas thermophila]SFF37216.1 Haem-degrading [Fontimonas thermophila]